MDFHVRGVCVYKYKHIWSLFNKQYYLNDIIHI